MPYIICNDNNYLFQDINGFSIVNEINRASRWKSIKSANNVCRNISLNKKLHKYNLQVKYVIQENKVINQPANLIEFNYDILDKIKEISVFTKQIEQRRLYLLEQLHNIDLELSDIEHAAEFYNLSASQGYKLYRLLHNARVKRRELKDELQKINLSLGTPIKSVDMSNLERSIEGLQHKYYTPRINKELFGV